MGALPRGWTELRNDEDSASSCAAETADTRYEMRSRQIHASQRTGPEPE